MKLTDREWKEFELGKLFKNHHGKRLIKSMRVGGNVPLLTASENNQGVSSFISNHKMISFKDFISIDMFGHAFYHSYECYGDDNIYFFVNNEISPYAKLFMVRCINQNGVKYSYGNQFRQDNADKDKILLPVNDKNKPDYQFMEDYIKEKMLKRRQEYIEYTKNKLKQIKFENISSLKDKKWKEFFVVDIFPSIQRGKRLIKDNQISGNVPYVSSTAMNNGVDNFIQYDSKKMRKFKNCLSVANSGSVGSSFYEPFEYIASDHVTHLKNDKFNQYIYFFIATMTNRWSQKYNFNREINDPRISREKILLPVNTNDEPDYIYMEKYIKNIFYKKYSDYLEYVKSTNASQNDKLYSN